MQSFHNKFYYERGFSCWAKNRTSELKIELIMNRVLTCSHTQRGKVGHSGHRSCQSKPWESTDCGKVLVICQSPELFTVQFNIRKFMGSGSSVKIGIDL